MKIKDKFIFKLDLPSITMLDCYVVKDYYVGSHNIALIIYSLSRGAVGDLTKDGPELPDDQIRVENYQWIMDVLHKLDIIRREITKDDKCTIYEIDTDRLNTIMITPEEYVEHEQAREANPLPTCLRPM